MPTETLKVGPRADEQMSSCFLKLYTPTRVCDIYIMSCSSAHLLTLKTFVYCAACYAAKHRSLGRMLSDIHPTSAQNPPYNCLITAYLRPIYGSKPRYDRDVTATSTYCLMAGIAAISGKFGNMYYPSPYRYSQ